MLYMNQSFKTSIGLLWGGETMIVKTAEVSVEYQWTYNSFDLKQFADPFRRVKRDISLRAQSLCVDFFAGATQQRKLIGYLKNVSIKFTKIFATWKLRVVCESYFSA